MNAPHAQTETFGARAAAVRAVLGLAFVLLAGLPAGAASTACSAGPSWAVEDAARQPWDARFDAPSEDSSVGSPLADGDGRDGSADAPPNCAAKEVVVPVGTAATAVGLLDAGPAAGCWLARGPPA